MAITRKIEDENLVVTVLSGRVSHHDLLKSFDELPQITHNLSELYELVINADDLHLESSNEMTKKIINKAAYVFNKYERATISIVSPKDLSFGIAMQFRANIISEKIDITVFRTEESARKWLDEMRSLYSGINSAFSKKYSKNPEVCFNLSVHSYENAKRLLDFLKYLIAQKNFSPAAALATLGTEEAIKAYELLLSSHNPERQKALSLYLGNPIKKHKSVKSVQQSVAIFEIILRLVNDLIDNYKNDPPSDISKLLSEIPSLIQKRLLEEKMDMISKK